MLRKSDYPIDQLFIHRWSPRSFTEKKIPSGILYTILEAARFAPSAANIQPWRFIIAQDEKELATFAEFISDKNRLWSDKAPVLILLISDKYRPSGEINTHHVFDTGAAWLSIALQANRLGLVTRAMVGFDKEKARELLHIPEKYEVLTVIALGYQGGKKELPKKYQELEEPNGRRPLSESIVSFFQ